MKKQPLQLALGLVLAAWVMPSVAAVKVLTGYPEQPMVTHPGVQPLASPPPSTTVCVATAQAIGSTFGLTLPV